MGTLESSGLPKHSIQSIRKAVACMSETAEEPSDLRVSFLMLVSSESARLKGTCKVTQL